MSNFQKSIEKTRKMIAYFETQVPTIMGVEAVNHFKESFTKQGFTDKGLDKWAEVERREEGVWKGFQYGSTVPRPGKKQRKKGAITNYSPAASKRQILTGQTMELQESIKWKPNGRGVTVFSDVPYAKIQNEGGAMRIFGKASGEIPKREFMGRSEVLRNKIKAIIMHDLNKMNV